MSAALRVEVKPGQHWRWNQPNGDVREMIVQSIYLHGGCCWVVGIYLEIG